MERNRKQLAAIEEEKARRRAREEERRKRDPTYNPNAIELNMHEVKAFDASVDYYALLEESEFASPLELKKAYMRLSLELHPDKQAGKSEAERAEAAARFDAMVKAYDILSDLPTRRAYDEARDVTAAKKTAGVHMPSEAVKPPPTCLDFECTLEELAKGCWKQVRFQRTVYKDTPHERLDGSAYFNCKVHKGELAGATFWHHEQGDMNAFGKADLVLVLQQTPHPLFERLGDDLWHYGTGEGKGKGEG